MMYISQIKQFVEANPQLVSRRESIKYPGLYVIKYKNKVFYDSLWTPELMETRGLIVDKDWNIVAFPFTKIFNRGENGTDIPLDERVIAVKKINGFMGCITKYRGEALISTTGSLDSIYVALAEKYLKPMVSILQPNMTYMFEICDESDPHIIREILGAHLIGIRNLDNGVMLSQRELDAWASHLTQNGFPVERPVWTEMAFSKVVEISKLCQHEGFVVYGKDTTLKIKSPYYLVNKFLARKNMDKLSKMLDNLPELKKTVDEEYYPLLDHIAKNRETYIQLNDQQRLEFMREFFNF